MSSSQSIHGSAAAFHDQAVLIIGQPGSGKTKLLIELMARGFVLIGDDSLIISQKNNALWLAPNPNAEQRLHLRGVGFFKAQNARTAPLKLVVDLDHPPQSNWPDKAEFNHFGKKILKICAKDFINLADLVYLIISGAITLAELDHCFE